jgi:hypothetical protein
MPVLFRCPKPDVWARIHQELVRNHQTASTVNDDPPMPLILNGWIFSSAKDKHERWNEMVEWAHAHGLGHVVTGLQIDDFATWDYNEPPGRP